VEGEVNERSPIALSPESRDLMRTLGAQVMDLARKAAADATLRPDAIGALPVSYDVLERVLSSPGGCN
jgi:hypothetical protein